MAKLARSRALSRPAQHTNTAGVAVELALLLRGFRCASHLSSVFQRIDPIIVDGGVDQGGVRAARLVSCSSDV